MKQNKVSIMAEAAQGFEGSSKLALLLVKAAAKAGADSIKFQLVYADELAARNYPYYDLFKSLEMSDDIWKQVAEACQQQNIRLVFDVYGPKALALAVQLGVKTVKIHSTDFYNEALFKGALEKMEEVFFSVGGIPVEEISAFLAQRSDEEIKRLTLMFGFQAEPTKIEDNHLSRLRAFREAFPSLQLGFMDHANGDDDEAGWLGLLTLPLGVTVIEKHITIDRSLELEDYISALNPLEFAAYVKRVRAALAALGKSDLDLFPEEQAYGDRAVKVIVALKDLPAGAVISEADITLLRAARDSALKPFRKISDVTGKKLSKEVLAGNPIYQEDLA